MDGSKTYSPNGREMKSKTKVNYVYSVPKLVK